MSQEELIMESSEKEQDIDLDGMAEAFGDMSEVGVVEGFETEDLSDDEYGNIASDGESLEDMFGNYSPYGKKTYVAKSDRYAGKIEGLTYADTDAKPLEHIIVHGKSYTDLTPLFLETPTDILFSNDINKLKK